MQWYFWLLLFVSMIAFTFLMKYLFNAKIYYFIISMIANTKSVKILDKIKQDKFWLWISKFGIFLGFGLLGLFAWYWKDLKLKKKPIKQIIFYSILLLIFAFLIGSFGTFGSTVYYVINIVVFFLFGFAGFGILLLAYQALMIIKAYFLGRTSCPGVAPVIPGLKVPGTDFKIPFFEGWLALIMIMVVHELAHGILARKIGVKVKSFGLLLLGFFPIGAFTEPDEKELKEAEPKKSLLVYSSGPTINLLFAIIIFTLSLGLTFIFGSYINNIQMQSADGLYITEFSEYTGLCNLGVSSENYLAMAPLFTLLDTNKDYFYNNYSAKIISFNDVNINNRKDFTNKLNALIDSNSKDVSLGLQIKDLNKNEVLIYNANLHLNTDNTLGIKSVELPKENYDYSFWYLFLMFILTTFQWTYLLSFMVGFFNFVPVKLLDGGQMLSLLLTELFPKYMKQDARLKTIKIVYWTIGIFLLILIAINILPLFL